MPTLQEGTAQPKNRVWYVSTEEYVNPIVAYATERYGRMARSFKEQQLALYKAYSPAALNAAIGQTISQMENMRLRLAKGNADAVSEANRNARAVIETQLKGQRLEQGERRMALNAQLQNAQIQGNLARPTRGSSGSSSGASSLPTPLRLNAAGDRYVNAYMGTLMNSQVYEDPARIQEQLDQLSNELEGQIQNARGATGSQGVGAVVNIARGIGKVYRRIRSQDQVKADRFLESAKSAMKESFHVDKWAYDATAQRFVNQQDFEVWVDEATDASANVQAPVDPVSYPASPSAAGSGTGGIVPPPANVTYETQSVGVADPVFEEQKRETPEEIEERLAPLKQYLFNLQADKAVSKRLYGMATEEPKKSPKKSPKKPRWNIFSRNKGDRTDTTESAPEQDIVVPTEPPEEAASDEVYEFEEGDTEVAQEGDTEVAQVEDTETAALEELEETGVPGPAVTPALSPRMTASNVATSRGIQNIPDEDQAAALAILEEEVISPLEQLGEVTSAFRSPELNAHPDIGGHSNSRHLAGKAVDLAPKPGVPLEKLVAAAEALRAQGIVEKVLVFRTPSPGHIHVAMRRS